MKQSKYLLGVLLAVLTVPTGVQSSSISKSDSPVPWMDAELTNLETSVSPLSLATHSRGLANVGNTCYFNATNQSLYAIPLVREEMARRKGDKAQALCRVLNVLFDRMGKGTCDGTFMNNIIRMLPKKRNSILLNRQQHDAYELLGEYFSMDIRPIEVGALESLFSRRVRTDVRYEKNMPELCQHPREDSNNNTTSSTLVIRNFINLNIDSATIQRNLDTSDNPTDAVPCEQCQDIPDDQRQQFKPIGQTYYTLPEVLMIHLARFGVDKKTNKLTKIINVVNSISPILNLHPTLNDQGLPTKGLPNVDFYLRSIILHGGTLGGGHYRAIVREGESWVMKDDSSSSPIAERPPVLEKEDTRRGAYILMYAKAATGTGASGSSTEEIEEITDTSTTEAGSTKPTTASSTESGSTTATTEAGTTTPTAASTTEAGATETGATSSAEAGSTGMTTTSTTEVGSMGTTTASITEANESTERPPALSAEGPAAATA